MLVTLLSLLLVQYSFFDRLIVAMPLTSLLDQDMSQHPPTQELVAKDLHGVEWRFRHIFRGDTSSSL